MTNAFLYLTYNEPNKSIKYLIRNKYNIYIHPKNKIEKYKEFVIPNIIDTEWGKYSIVEATINLLDEAFKNTNNKYFILCSEDCFLLHKDVDKYIDKTYSQFNFIKKENNYYKTSQWFILNRHDAKIILDTKIKYQNQFKNVKLQGAVDEYYFLTVLKNNINNYEYINFNYMYVSWLKYSITKHPIIFNKLTNYDYKDIKQSLFIRKVLPTFSIKKYINSKTLYIVFIGYKTNYIDYLLKSNIDIIIVTSLKIDNIHPELLKKCIRIYSIIFKFYNEFIIDICLSHTEFLLQWSHGVYFINEIFDFENINQIIKIDKFTVKFNHKSVSKLLHFLPNNSFFIATENIYHYF